MDTAVASVIVGIGATIITAILAPLILSEVKKREERDPAKGWQAAFAFMQSRIDKMDEEIQELRAEVNRLEDDNETKASLILKLESVITEQSSWISARDRRIAQLEAAWPPGVTMPAPDPAFRRLLNQT